MKLEKERKKESRGGLVVEGLLHKRLDSATVDRIPLGTMCLYGTFETRFI